MTTDKIIISTTEPTKGPWRNNGGQIESDNSVIGTVGIVNRQTRQDTANANLIAASPALLRSAEVALEICRAMADPEHCMHEAFKTTPLKLWAQWRNVMKDAIEAAK